MSGNCACQFLVSAAYLLSMKVLPHTRSCFVCGESNPIGLNLRFHTDGRLVQTKFSFRPEHVGFQQTIHGGLISTLLDEVMVWACAVQTRRFAYCAELAIRFLHPTRPGTELVVTAELAENRRNRIFEAKSALRDSKGLVLATGAGKYLPMKEEAEFAADFVGSPDWLNRPATGSP